MAKIITLKLTSGNLKIGFSACLEIAPEGKASHDQHQGKLPAAVELLSAYEYWHSIYINLGKSRRLEAPEEQVKNSSSPENCQQAAKTVIQALNTWLNSDTFRPLRDALLIELNSNQKSIRILIQTDDLATQRLPWHFWELCEKYPQVEIAFCRPNYQQILPPLKQDKKVKILAIIGDKTGIKPEADLETWNKYGADLHYLIEPKREEINDQLWQAGWDILFFAGHSRTVKETGKIKINPNDSLKIDDLKYGLRQAISQGLQLAIFNSCDGLGLAKDIADLNIAQTIFMREPVPDQVAQKFLDYFLSHYTKGESLYLSVRKGREKLQGLETEFPCATWLPVIYQNPAIIPPTWQELRQGRRKLNLVLPAHILRYLHPVTVATLGVFFCVLGMRSLGLLEHFELKAYDHFMQNRPDEGKDQRLLIVTVDEEDLEYQDQQGMQRQGSLSDAALSQLIEKLEPYQPRVIGSDIYHDFPVDSNYAKLAEFFQTSPKFIGICKDSDRNSNAPGIKPPLEVPPDRLGFSNILKDQDGLLRRHFWYMTPPVNTPCPTEKSLSLQLALSYLTQEGINPEVTPQGNLKLGQVVLKRLDSDLGGYHQLDTNGYQMLLNYRSGEIAETISLKQLLTEPINPNLVRDKVILIGNIVASYKDYHETPFTRNPVLQEKMPGVFIQAQMGSQIISAVKDGRPLLTVVPRWVEILWILGWSLIGGVLAWRVRSSVIFYFTEAGIFVILYGICFVGFLGGYWIPLIPSSLAVLATSASIRIFSIR